MIPPGGIPEKVKFTQNQKLLWADSQRMKQQLAGNGPIGQQAAELPDLMPGSDESESDGE